MELVCDLIDYLANILFLNIWPAGTARFPSQVGRCARSAMVVALGTLSVGKPPSTESAASRRTDCSSLNKPPIECTTVVSTHRVLGPAPLCPSYST